MKLQDQFIHKSRRAGATTWMLKHLVDAVYQGEPTSIVVCAYRNEISSLRKYTLKLLAEKGMRIDTDCQFNTIFTEGSRISFLTANEFAFRKMGIVAGIYIDHYAIESLSISQESLDFIYKQYNLEE